MLVGSYMLAPLLLEYLVARGLQDRLTLNYTPDVNLVSDSPLDMLTGRFEEAQVTFSYPELGGMRPDAVTMNLEPFDLDVLGSVRSGRVRSDGPLSGGFRAELSEGELSRIAASSVIAAPVRGVELEEGQVIVDSEVEVFGARVPVGVEGGIVLLDGALRFEPRLVEALGAPVPQALTQGLLQGANFSYPIGEVPFGGVLSGVEVHKDRLVLFGEVENLSLGQDAAMAPG